jgi:glutamate synthase domain-containing protein 3
VSVCHLDDPDVARLRDLLERYAAATGSLRALELLADWPHALESLAKLSPEIALPEPVGTAARSESLSR